MVIYFSLDDKGYLTGWSSTRSSDNDMCVWVENNHEVLTDPEVFKYVDGYLEKDEEKQRELIKQREKEDNRTPKEEQNTMAIMELANMIALIYMPTSRMAMSRGDNVIALLFATNIIEGLWTFDNVGHLWKEDVRKILIAEGREDLIK